MFQDEGRFGRISGAKRCWAPEGMRPDCPAQFVREYVYALSALSPHDGIIESLIAPRVDAGTMSIFLKQVSERFMDEFVIMVMDLAGWHTAKALSVPENIHIIHLPPRSPDLNPVEHLWEEVREKWFENLVLKSLDAVEGLLFDALSFMNTHPAKVKSFTGYEWIINIPLNAK